MDTTKCLNDLRKMTPEQRKEILSLIEKEEQLEQDALKQNPNLHIERQMKQVLSELHALRADLQTFKCTKQNIANSTHTTPTTNKALHEMQENDILSYLMQNPTYKFDTLTNLDDIEPHEDTGCSMFSLDWLPMWIFLILLLVSLLAPSKTRII